LKKITIPAVWTCQEDNSLQVRIDTDLMGKRKTLKACTTKKFSGLEVVKETVRIINRFPQ